MTHLKNNEAPANGRGCVADASQVTDGIDSLLIAGATDVNSILKHSPTLSMKTVRVSMATPLLASFSASKVKSSLRRKGGLVMTQSKPFVS